MHYYHVASYINIMGRSYSQFLLDQKVTRVEVRSTNSEDPLKLLGSKHCFIVVTTESNVKVKYDFDEKGKCIVDYAYLDWIPSETLLKDSPSELTVREMTMIYNKNCNLSSAHNCQFITYNTFDEIFNTDFEYSRNDMLFILSTKSKKKYKNLLWTDDPQHWHLSRRFLPINNKKYDFDYYQNKYLNYIFSWKNSESRYKNDINK